ncbi:hypothetical protein EDC19_1105 [Natranaerovirga hydrolytica]|uniref:Uncharacterized protein n=1 Tax=Natranaerovirga hydrolytica TaxID=680378 RepID=A0A4R1N183_9FIRM|nr:hypothetical protein [Natranaerovirga hydrolytica]TCK98672.1 hypothetical protein EDC19_1105 [Natranaerovirga hydrolytica]
MSDKTIKEIFENMRYYIICSTLNQVVNYIPLDLHRQGTKEKSEEIMIYNLTESETKNNSEKKSLFKRFDNQAWDENLFSVVPKEKYNYEEKTIVINEFLNTNKSNTGKEISKAIKRINICSNEGEVIWNITGGQKTTLLKILNFIQQENRKNDYVIYLEGNSNKMFYGKLNQYKQFEYKELGNQYWNKELDLQTIFNLSGYQYEDNIKNYLETNLEYADVYKKLNEIYDKCEDADALKKDNVQDKDKYKIKFLIELVKLNKEGEGDKFIQEMKRIAEELNVNMDNSNEIQKIVNAYKSEKVKRFGYIFEKMSILRIKEAVEELNIENHYFLELKHSVKINKKQNKFGKHIKELCEFDIVLSTASGQVVVFECKSGTMESNTGKARVYTAYATNGVYGKPILLIPFYKSQISIIHKYLFGDEKNMDQPEYKELRENFENILSAYRAALRSNMDIWGLDEIKDGLNELYIDALPVKG